MRRVRRIRREGQGAELIRERLEAIAADLEGIDAKVALIQELIPLGLMHVEEELKREVAALAGPRYARGGGRAGVVRLRKAAWLGLPGGSEAWDRGARA